MNKLESIWSFWSEAQCRLFILKDILQYRNKAAVWLNIHTEQFCILLFC